MTANAPPHRRLRMGLVGGGGGFIGRVHAMAATFDGRADLVAGALSSDPAKAKALAPDFHIPPQRAYTSYQEMVARERALPTDQRIDFVSIATPNDTHFEIARAFIEAGFHVMCDKPMTIRLEHAQELTRLVGETGVVFGVTHNYTGYPLVRQAREMIRAGELGEINAVRASYLQATLFRRRSPEQQRRFAWKTDPERAGASGCFGDIGTHAFNLVRFVSGLVPTDVSCELRVFHPAGRLDDYGFARLRFTTGALGTITASRVSHGRENDLTLEIDGTLGALTWRQEEPNSMWFGTNGQPQRVFTRDPCSTHEKVRSSCRLPAGYPEGFIQAFANVYLAAYADMLGPARGTKNMLYPGVADGLEGVRFVTQCVASSQEDGAWHDFSCDVALLKKEA